MTRGDDGASFLIHAIMVGTLIPGFGMGQSREIQRMPGVLMPGMFEQYAADHTGPIRVWGGPPSPTPRCDVEVVARRLDRFFRGVSARDPGVVREFFPAPEANFSFYSIRGRGPTSIFVQDVKELRRHFEERFAQEEQIELRAIQVNRWSDGLAHFGPFLAWRSARDLEGRVLMTGKGAIDCANGRLVALYMSS